MPSNDQLTHLVQATENDPEFKKTVLEFLYAPIPDRHSMLAKLVSNVRSKNGPPELVEALESLQDSKSAKIARNLVEGKEPGANKNLSLLVSGAFGVALVGMMIFFFSLFLT